MMNTRTLIQQYFFWSIRNAFYNLQRDLQCCEWKSNQEKLFENRIQQVK